MLSDSFHESKCSIDFKSYLENGDYLVQGQAELNSRSQILIFHSEGHKCSVDRPVSNKTPKRQRRKEYQDFIRLIDLRSLPLLNDTVSEVVLEEYTDEHRYTIREDLPRVIYPSCREFPSLRQISKAKLLEQSEITDGVSHVVDVNDRTPYILKVVNRPLYQAHDTETIRNELKDLEYFRGEPNIAQLAGIAVATNPYTTSSATEQPPVIFGILSVFYPGGSLQNLLDKDRVREHSWESWTIQIATAISYLHKAGIIHMNIKPSNVVLDADGNAVLIDISGVGRITHMWLAPEIRKEISPAGLPFEVRQRNDTWAYGKLLSEIISHAGFCPFLETLNHIASCLTGEDTQTRMALLEAISQLKDAGVDRALL
ncbi:kinase-like protein [Aspergillus campestris IBT 28561]|uniref:Kinase-like protein n=1 Tax=Aspergillus campestris (strain IBT 28561) TaxID=1392248 RepID=A0A2I1CQD5_ASPC2|nr:kinase-like protein [Aspergillus campestris IBT 28561]PKX99842.1 kinase-like protein [Aspergillus campestris IBT 28561]